MVLNSLFNYMVRYFFLFFSGKDLKDTSYYHVFYKDQICKFYIGSHVSATKGTGLVHTAPAHGPDDFLIALEHNLNIVRLTFSIK